LAVSSIIQNDWMHMNVTWRSNWLEWIIEVDPGFWTGGLGGADAVPF
jgi:hypothetical protein